MEWKNIEINIQNIEASSERSVLIKMPNKSKYAGYKFWHPAKLVREGLNSYAKNLGYNDEFQFRLFKTGNGKYNQREIIDSITIDAQEFEEAFEVMSKNISAKKPVNPFETHKPEEIEAKDIDALDELKDE